MKKKNHENEYEYVIEYVELTLNMLYDCAQINVHNKYKMGKKRISGAEYAPYSSIL